MEPETGAEVSPQKVAAVEPEPVLKAEPEDAVEAEPEKALKAEPEQALKAEHEKAGEVEPKAVAEADAERAPEPLLPLWKRLFTRKKEPKVKAVKIKLTPAQHAARIGEMIRTIVVAVLLAFGFRSVALEPFTIPSGSMIPTLLVGDYLFVSKYSYGYSHYSFPLSLPLFDGRVFASEPERGDVAVFRLPRDTSIDYIKRVIGLPGDRVQMRQGRLYINGTLVPRRKVSDYKEETAYGSKLRSQRYIETLPGGVEHVIIEANDYSPFDDTREYVVPEGHYFMMGDNRDNSQDSRADVGFVPLENFIGRAEFTFYSFADSTSLWEFWKWPTSVRWERLFRSIGPVGNADEGLEGE